MTDSIYPLQLSAWQDRINSILGQTNGTIVFDSDSVYAGHVENAYPFWSADGLGSVAAENNRAAINFYAAKNHIDPVLLSASVYMENSHDYYDLGLLGKTEGPGNINLDTWSGLLGITSQDIRGGSSLNISLAARILAGIQERLVNPTPEAIASLYNSMLRDKVSDYGLSVARIMQDQPWTRCFPAHIPISISLTSTTPIADLRIGDVVLAFDPCAGCWRCNRAP